MLQEQIEEKIEIKISHRIKDINRVGFKCTLLHEFKTNAWDAIMTEQAIHRNFKRYYSKFKFDGYTELHHKDDLESIKQYVEGKI